MQLVVGRHVEDRDVRVLPGDPPDVRPLPGPLQALGVLLFPGHDLGPRRGREIVREPDIHAHVKEHQPTGSRMKPYSTLRLPSDWVTGASISSGFTAAATSSSLCWSPGK